MHDGGSHDTFAWRARPPSIQQTILTCWAAAISSFSRAVFGIKDFAGVPDVQAELRSFAAGEINADGSLQTPSGWITFARKFGLHVEEIRIRDPLSRRAGHASPGVRVSKVADDLRASHFVPKLHRSHVIVVKGTHDDTRPAHTVVVYGVDRFRLCFMDPLADPALATDPAVSPDAVPLRPRGGSGRAGENWYCETYQDFTDGPRYLLIWK